MTVVKDTLQDSQTRNNLKVYSLDQIKKLDVSELIKVDPERIKVGTDLQDSCLIAHAYERGAHYTAKEAAVFATLNRHVDNYRHISKGASAMLKAYLYAPENSISKQILQSQELNSASEQSAQAQSLTETGLRAAGQDSLADTLFPPSASSSGKSGQAASQALETTTGEQSMDNAEGFGDKFGKWVSDCIPCDLRITSWLELNPGIDLTNLLEASIKGMLDFLNGLGNMLRNLDIFGDFCALMDLFNFTCIPDLQRILLLLSTLLAFEMPSLDGLIGLVQALIAPLFTPILTSIVGLFDQFQLLVANPLECIVDALNLQIEKLPKADNPAVNATGSETTRIVGEINSELQTAMGKANAFSQEVGEGLSIMKQFIEQAIAMIKEKIQFYLGDLQSLMGEMSATDGAYIGASLRKLQMVRLISFITALITALASGNTGFCKDGGKAEAHEIDAFYNNYLGPNMSFAVSVDDKGNLSFTEKNLSEKIKEDLRNRQNVFEFEGKDLVSEQVTQVARNLTQPVRVTKPCRIEVAASEAVTLNRYVSELNSL